MENQSQISENNKMIAEFMGLEFYEPHNTWLKNGILYSKVLKYNTDWNWLMPVIDEIEKLGFEFTIKRFSVQIETTSWSGKWMKNVEYSKTLVCAGNRVELIFSAIIQFLEWYNENK
jgi:hypothetical protein